MNTTVNKLIIASLMLGFAFAGSITAAPAGKQVPTSSRALRTTEEFQQLKKGDPVAMVCKECDSVTVKHLESDEEGMALCKEGEAVTCPSCNKAYKVVRRQGPRSQATGSRLEVKYVNDQGEECMFIAKMNE